MDEIEAQCKAYQPVGAPTPRYDILPGTFLYSYTNTDSKLTDTNDFNENMNRINSDVL